MRDVSVTPSMFPLRRSAPRFRWYAGEDLGAGINLALFDNLSRFPLALVKQRGKKEEEKERKGDERRR